MTDPAAKPVNTFAAKWIRRWATICGVLLGVIAILSVAVVALSARNGADRANNNIISQCQVWRDIGSSPISATTTALGLSLVADGRAQYLRLDCLAKYGPLPPTDPRVEAVMRAHAAGN